MIRREYLMVDSVLCPSPSKPKGLDRTTRPFRYTVTRYPTLRDTVAITKQDPHEKPENVIQTLKSAQDFFLQTT